MKKQQYCIWLTFTESESGEKLEQEVLRLSKLWRGPLFTPHLTIAGRLHSHKTQAELIQELETLTGSLRSFSCHKRRIYGKENFYKNYYLEVCLDRSLIHLRKKVLDIFETKNETEVFTSHISLYYGDRDWKTKYSEFTKTLANTPRTITPTYLSIVKSAADEQKTSWEVIKSFKLFGP